MLADWPRIDLTTPDDQYYNYCWWPYDPVASTAGKLRPVALLRHSFEVGGMGSSGMDLVERIQAEIGLFRTVFGIKWLGDRIAWEYYFYDYARRDRDVSITRLLETVRPSAPSSLAINENLPYFMFSLDIDQSLNCGERCIDTVHMYVGNPGSSVSSGIAYEISEDRIRLENFYFFFDAKKHLQDAAEKIYCSPHVDAGQIGIEHILRPEFVDCHTICVANKQHHDTAYFSGVNVRQLLQFLTWLSYPDALVSFVRQQQHQLDHLLFDIGFDYTSRDSNLYILKSGYYGVF